MINSMAQIFDKYCKREMVRLPQQYNPEKIDPNRFEFDQEILQSLGISIKDNQLRELYKNIYESFSQWFVVD